MLRISMLRINTKLRYLQYNKAHEENAKTTTMQITTRAITIIFGKPNMKTIK
jgi:hypothetical protein